MLSREIESWLPNIAANDKWQYDALRDDPFLEAIFSDFDLRAKYHEVVRKFFATVVAPFINSNIFSKAKGKDDEYCADDLYRDIYQRLFLPALRRKSKGSSNFVKIKGIDFWIQNRRCAKSLADFVQLECWRQLVAEIKRQQRRRQRQRFVSVNVENIVAFKEVRRDENEVSAAVQNAFDKLFIKKQLSAYLCSSYVSSGLRFATIARIWKIKETCASKRFRDVCENLRAQLSESLGTDIDKTSWRKGLRDLKGNSKANEKTNEDEEKTRERATIYGGASSADWKKYVIFFESTLKDDDIKLLNNVLERQQAIESGDLKKYQATQYSIRTQGGGLGPCCDGFSDVERLVDPEEMRNRDTSSHSTKGTYFNPKISREKYARSNALSLFFSSTDDVPREAKWLARLDLPLDGNADSEIDFTIDCNDRGNAVAINFALCKTLRSKVKYDVATFKLGEFLASTGAHAPELTLKIRAPRSGAKRQNWHDEVRTKGRLLFCAPTGGPPLSDDE